MNRKMAEILKKVKSTQTELEGGLFLPKEIAEGLIAYVEALETHYHEVLDDAEKHSQTLMNILMKNTPPQMREAFQKIIDSTKVT